MTAPVVFDSTPRYANGVPASNAVLNAATDANPITTYTLLPGVPGVSADIVKKATYTTSQEYIDVVTPNPNPPIVSPPAPTTTPPDSTLSTTQPPPPTNTPTANDDSGASDNTTTPVGTIPNANGNTTTAATTPDIAQDTSISDNNIQATIDNGGSNNTPPGNRLNNPLGQFSSYTYNISLYMISPAALTAFMASGGTDITVLNDAITTSGQANNSNTNSTDTGAVLIAQSGGIHTADRAPYFEYDYYIDNVVMDASIGTKDTGAAASSYNISFEIIEPFGFSLMSNLKKAGDLVYPTSTTTTDTSTASTASNTMGGIDALRQHFIMGIKFVGYDEDGNIMTTGSSFDGGILDPGSTSTTSTDLFDYYLDINFNNLKFHLDGTGASKYYFEGVPVALKTALGALYGISIDTTHVVEANVKDALNQLMLNQTTIQQKQVAAGTRTYPNTYLIQWLPNTTTIQNASIISPADLDKSKWAPADITTSKASNQKTASTTPASNKKIEIKFGNDMSLLQCINNVIQQSSYVRDSLTAVYSSQIELNNKTPSQNQQTGGTKKIGWYRIIPSVTNPIWDPKVSSWAYTITYAISTYDTPITDSAYINKLTATDYPGPYKRYKYWYTGENTEVLDFDVDFSYSYFQSTVLFEDTANTSSNTSSSSSSIPSKPGTQTSQSRTGALGPGLETQNNYITSLYDPGAFTNAKLKILGDPDFLTSPIPTVGTPNSSISSPLYQKYYSSNGYSINPDSGQVIVEVDMLEALDYNDGTGVMRKNDSIFFFPIPTELANATDSNGNKLIQGAPFGVNKVTSTFSKGEFTQELVLFNADLSTFVGNNTDDTPTATTATTTPPTGTPKDPPVTPKPVPTPPTNLYNQPGIQGTNVLKSH